MLKSQRTILLTGGTSGIGLALLARLLNQGHKLVVLARNQKKLEELQKQNKNVVTYSCDLSARLEIESTLDAIMQNHPEISVLINNAAIQNTPTFLDKDFNYDTIEYETTVNFLAPVWISYLLLPSLTAAREPAAIVNLSSGLAFAPKTDSAVYCATKAALHSISQSLRYQLSASNVQVIEVILPLVDTPMTEGRGRGKISSDEAAKQIIQGMNKNKPEIYVGIARLLPLLARVSPSLLKGMMRKG